MVATFSWHQTYSAQSTPLEASASALNLVNTKDVHSADPSTYPITVGENSYELWMRGRFTGTWTDISNIQFGMVSGSFLSGESVYVSWIQPTGQAYRTPVKTNSTIAVSSIPSSGTPCIVGVSGSTATTLTSNAINATSGQMTDWVILQLRTSSNMPAGNTQLKTFSITFTET